MTRMLARAINPWTLLLVGWGLFLVHAYPGLMMRDSFEQLHQARAGFFSDDHPPLMQVILSVTDVVIPGPFGVVLLQTAMLVAGVYLILRRLMRECTAAVISVGFLWLPPVAAVMVVLGKDPMMAGALMLATALIISPRRLLRLVALGLVVVATGVRLNALAATFGIVVLLFEWLAPQASTWGQRLTRYGVSLAVWVATVVIAFALNATLTDRETYVWHTSLVGDIVGTLYFVDGERTDASLQGALAGTKLRHQRNIHAELRKVYRPESMRGVVFGEQRAFDLPPADIEAPSPELREALYRAWKTIVFGNAFAYLRYRLDRFRVVVGLNTPDEDAWDRTIIVTHDVQDSASLRELGIPTAISPVHSNVDAMWTSASHTPLFRPYLWLAVALILLALAGRYPLALALLLSGIGIELSLFFLAPATDYRYSHWMICATLLAAIVLFVERRRATLHGTTSG
jgi:hypothetical protein